VGDRVDFAVETETLDDCAVVRVDGELDMSGAASLEEALSAAAERPSIVLDLSGCTFLDSAGVRAIAGAARQSGRVSIVATDPGIVRVLEITALDTLVSVHPSLEDAR
jgi:anti-sigma B factor antagonist